jgi:hypothetical protein
MQVDLDHERGFRDNERWRTIPWNRSLPFVDAGPSGVLIHRVRSACSHIFDGENSHYSVTYWCGNSGRGKLLDVPPDGRIVCARCEAAAVARGKPTSDQLAGHHVHKGGVRPYRTCCQDKGEN